MCATPPAEPVDPDRVPGGNPEVGVRRAVPADVPLLLELRLAFDAELAGLPPAERVTGHAAAVRDYLESHLADGRLLAWAAEAADGTLVGMAAMVVIDRPPQPRSRRPGEGFVYNVYVAPGWRRRGIARRLMDAVIDAARELGLRRVVLRTSAAGQPLYDSLGFVDPGYYRQLDLD
ncbi:MAG: GNAT family N-acetyltransferase [Chloroflexi bacterium]|jgi:GNAT superfamily N-acetyltransferase|nr:GNAT family N-acetyltransferase [Chloroflexota bacterium]